jgi:hypothetical protein
VGRIHTPATLLPGLDRDKRLPSVRPFALVARYLYTAVAEGRQDDDFQGLRDEHYEPGDILRVRSETWRIDSVEDTGFADRKKDLLARTLHCSVV